MQDTDLNNIVCVLDFQFKAASIAPTQRLARTIADSSGLDRGTDIAGLASLGAGKWTGNVERDFHRWFKGACGLKLDLTTIRIPFWSADGLREEDTDLPVLTPKVVVQSLWSYSEQVFEQTMLGDAGVDLAPSQTILLVAEQCCLSAQLGIVLHSCKLKPDICECLAQIAPQIGSLWPDR